MSVPRYSILVHVSSAVHQDGLEIRWFRLLFSVVINFSGLPRPGCISYSFHVH
jgi:hypothetical protein